MEEISYRDFDLLIERVGRKFRARVLDSPSGPTRAIEFPSPVTKQALQIFLLTIGRPRQATRRIDSPVKREVKKLGGRLYRSVIREQIRDALVKSQQLARANNQGLRIRLHLDSPALADLPWEYLYNEANDSFLSLSRVTPIVRYLEIDDSPAPLLLRFPIRALTVISSPSGYPRLDVEREWSKLQGALQAQQASGHVALERLESPTVDELQRVLQLNQFHVLHFIGHGGFRESTDEGVLLFENEFGEGQQVSGEELGILLQDHPSLRLVVLNACEGARGSPEDPFSGTAQSLVRRGVPAVVAMQFEITDTAAITFSRSFYRALAAGFPVDSALAEARKSIRLEGNEIEWGTPVLYTITTDGRIFALPTEEEKQARQEQAQQAEEEQRQARQEQAQQAEEEQRQAREEQERQARQEQAQQAEEEQRHAREEQARQAREQQARQAREEQAREEQARQAREEQARQAREEAERREEAHHRAEQDAINHYLVRAKGRLRAAGYGVSEDVRHENQLFRLVARKTEKSRDFYSDSSKNELWKVTTYFLFASLVGTVEEVTAFYKSSFKYVKHQKASREDRSEYWWFPVALVIGMDESSRIGLAKLKAPGVSVVGKGIVVDVTSGDVIWDSGITEFPHLGANQLLKRRMEQVLGLEVGPIGFSAEYMARAQEERERVAREEQEPQARE